MVQLRGTVGGALVSNTVEPSRDAPWTSSPIDIAAGELEMTIQPSGGTVVACSAAIIPEAVGSRP